MGTDVEMNTMRQLVYRQERYEPFIVPDIPEISFLFCDSLSGGLRIAGALHRQFGMAGVLKALAKLLSGRRKFYCLLKEGKIVSHGWANISFCRHYKVQPNDVVIGPVWTEPEFRNMGFSSYALKKVMNEMMAAGSKTFFVDTAEDNIPMQKVIVGCGFGAPESAYSRPHEIK
jgi:hypothetical protein